MRQLILRGVAFHLRSHLGVMAGAAVAAAVLAGALAVGESVRTSLRKRAERGLAGFDQVLSAGDRFFRLDLAERILKGRTGSGLSESGAAAGSVLGGVAESWTLLALPGMANRQDGAARANRIQVLGMDGRVATNVLGAGAAWGEDRVWFNPALASQLNAKVGDEVILRIHKPSAMSRDTILTPRDESSVAMRMTVAGVWGGEAGGDLQLHANQAAPMNAWVDLARLERASGLEGRANWILSGRSGKFGSELKALGDEQDGQRRNGIREGWRLEDAELSLQVREGVSMPVTTESPSGRGSVVELTSRRIFLDPAVEKILAGLGNSTRVLTYLVNSIRSGDRLTPYSMVSAAEWPYTPRDLKDDEIVVNEWLAEDLGVQAGGTVDLAYYVLDSAAQLVERTNRFRVREVAPMTGWQADRTLMPEFPGLSKAESTHEWDAGFELVLKVRDKDEEYWKKWRGTPKAFVTLAAGQRMWGNRFGNLTSVRWRSGPENGGSAVLPVRAGQLAEAIRRGLNPAEMGLSWDRARERVLTAAATGQDFGELFLAFSFFLIAAALMLMGLLFRFGVEQRRQEIGTLLAVGWSPARVAQVFLGEGLCLALAGSALGAGGGWIYGQGVVYGLNTVWREAVGGAGLEFAMTRASWLGGIGAGAVVAVVSMALAFRSAVRRPARELLSAAAGDDQGAIVGTNRAPRRWIAVVFTGVSVVLAGATAGAPEGARAGMFFGSGAALLCAGLAWVRVLFRGEISASKRASGALLGSEFNFGSISWRGPRRKPSRSVATVFLLATAAFLVASVAANRLETPKNLRARNSGTGGFLLWGESALPILQDLNSVRGREFYGLDAGVLEGASVVPFRVRDGDDASCLNLNRAQRPRLLGVDPSELAKRGAFQMSGVWAEAAGRVGKGPGGFWELLDGPKGGEGGGATADEVWAIGDANSIQWALRKKLGETLEYVDERGRSFRVRIVGAVANSILQGNLVVSEAALKARFPGETGHRAFLVDASVEKLSEISAQLTRALQDAGVEWTPTSVRLNRFNAVQNTYLNTFQALGGLGLLLGSVGLGVVVLRNVLERRGELGVLMAIGFDRSRVQSLVAREHWVLLGLGLAVGLGASLPAVIPALLKFGNAFPWGSLLWILFAVTANGVAWVWFATQHALRGGILEALRDE